jgi:S1-C subfamily serine protease
MGDVMHCRAIVGIALIALIAAGCGGGSSKKSKSSSSPPTTIGPLTPQQVFERTHLQTVEILAKQGDSNVSGSGVIIDAPKGLVLTAAHVIAGMSTVSVRVADGDTALPARVVGQAPCEDVAVVQMQTPPPNLQQATLGASASVANEAPVVVLGYPVSASGSTNPKVQSTNGTVQSPDIPLANLGDYPALPHMVQHGARINSGNSGGPLFNDRGELIGINVVFNKDTDQNYSIAVDHIKQLLPDLEAGKNSSYAGWDLTQVAATDVNSYVFDNIGTSADADAVSSTVDDVGLDNVLFVAGVDAGSPADGAHIGKGDTIATMNGTTVQSVADVCGVLASSGPGATVKVQGIYTASGSGITAGKGWTQNMKLKP